VSQKLLSLVTRGFERPGCPLGTEKLLSPVTRGFDRPDCPLGTQKLLSWGRVDSTGQTAP